MIYKILICDKIADEGIKLLEEKGYQVTKAWDKPKPELPKLAVEYHALIVRSATKVNAEMLSNAKNLRVIGRAGEGLDNVDLKKAEELGIKVVNTPHVSYLSVAELTIGYLLSLARKIVEGTASLREGKWKKDELMGVEVNGETFGIIACGGRMCLRPFHPYRRNVASSRLHHHSCAAHASHKTHALNKRVQHDEGRRNVNRLFPGWRG